MHPGRIAMVGFGGGLLGEIMATELARYGPLVVTPDIDALIARAGDPPEAIVLWTEITRLGAIRSALREALPAGADALLVVVGPVDPAVYYTRVRDGHVDRRQPGFDEIFTEIARQVAAGAATTAPARTRLA